MGKNADLEGRVNSKERVLLKPTHKVVGKVVGAVQPSDFQSCVFRISLTK